MSIKPNGGPAFPGQHMTGQIEYVEGVGNRYVTEPHDGMSLRDYLAAKAMQSLILADLETIYPEWLMRNEQGQISISKTAYAMADAMLEERNS